MKAIRIAAFGSADVLTLKEIERPACGANDVVIKVGASGVNPIEWKIRSGAMAGVLARLLPVTLGWECAGIIVEIGPDVDHWKLGDNVFALTDFSRDGTHAEYIATDARNVAPKPVSLSYEQAATVPMTAQAAWSVLEAAALTAGQSVLIHGAGGSVGHWLIQFAKQAGLHVTGTASTADLETISALGCDDVIDYRNQRFEDAGTFDAVADLVGGETQERSWGVIVRGGRLVSLAAPLAPEREGVRGLFVFTQPRGSVLTKISALLDSGALVPLPVKTQLPLSKAKLIHELGESGKSGKSVLTVASL